MTTLDAVSLVTGALAGVLIGLVIGYVIWYRNRSETAALGELRWSQLFGSILAVMSLAIGASDTVTIALIALIPAENVALGLAKRVEGK